MKNVKSMEKELKAFANRRRLAIVQYLKRHKRVPVGKIAKSIRASFKATSKQLIILKNAGIVEVRQDGQQMLYSIARKHTPVVWRLIALL